MWHSEPDSETKVLGGLIAKRLVKVEGRLPEPDGIRPEHLDAAAKYVQKKSDHNGSIERAKQEALRLLGKAREMRSMRAAMEVYKRELRQIYETEKQHESSVKKLRKRMPELKASATKRLRHLRRDIEDMPKGMLVAIVVGVVGVAVFGLMMVMR